MEKYNADLLISVDLKKIAHYHGSIPLKIEQLTKDDLLSDGYPVTLKVSVIASLMNSELHPAYAYFDYTNNSGITEEKANHLIYIVHLLCKYEWNIYTHAIVNHNNTRDLYLPHGTEEKSFNFINVALNELSRLRLLCQFHERNLTELAVTITHNGTKPRNKNAKGYRNKYVVERLEIEDVELVRPILKTAIDSHFKLIQESRNPYLVHAISNIKTPTSSTLQLAIDSLEPQPTQGAALSTFRKLIAKRSIQYLNNDTELTSEPNEISPDQAEIIYSLLALFRIIDFELIDGHSDRTSRVKYIRSLLFNTGNLKAIKPIVEQEANSCENLTFKLLF